MSRNSASDWGGKGLGRHHATLMAADARLEPSEGLASSDMTGSSTGWPPGVPSLVFLRIRVQGPTSGSVTNLATTQVQLEWKLRVL